MIGRICTGRGMRVAAVGCVAMAGACGAGGPPRGERDRSVDTVYVARDERERPTLGGGPESRWRRIVGIIELDGKSLAAPDTVEAGEPFAVTVTTFGSSSCTRAIGAAVEVAGNEAGIVPLDEGYAPAICTDDWEPFPREVTVRFRRPGAGIVRLRGIYVRDTLTVEHRVVVRR